MRARPTVITAGLAMLVGSAGFARDPYVYVGRSLEKPEDWQHRVKITGYINWRGLRPTRRIDVMAFRVERADAGVFRMDDTPISEVVLSPNDRFVLSVPKNMKVRIDIPSWEALQDNELVIEAIEDLTIEMTAAPLGHASPDGGDR